MNASLRGGRQADAAIQLKRHGRGMGSFTPLIAACWIASSLTLLAMTMTQTHAAPPSPIQRSNAPIDITADKLEVFQEENRAVFTGRVVAIQEEVRLTSDRMVVHYRPQEEGAAKTPVSPKQDAIRKIEVEQNVFLATPQETASGAAGVYDVEKNEIILTDNVVLTKGKNTLKGDHLTYNMATGKSVLTSGDAPAADGKGRVRALFVPDKDKKTP